MNQENIAANFNVSHCGRIYEVIIDRKRLGSMCAKASTNKSKKAVDGPAMVKDTGKEDPHP